MSTVLAETAKPAAPAGLAPSRAAGLYAAPKGHMTPAFGLLTAFLVLDVASFVIPFYFSRFGDSPWGSPERMGFLARAMGSALAFGFAASVAAERRNHSSWWFLSGHAGFLVALGFVFAGFDIALPKPGRALFDPRGPVGASAWVITAGFLGTIAALIATRKPRPALRPMDRALASVCRFMHAWGNIWFGISLMVAIGAMVAAGTFLENRYGTKGAQYLVYRAPWFGAVFFAGGVSMLCATFRKYPFRLEQAGWLTVHTGLALVVIGGMASFLSSVDGSVTIREGETIETFRLSTQTRLAVDAIVTRPNGTKTARPLLRTIADFDVNPVNTHPDRVYDVPTEDGEAPIKLVVDRFFGMGRPYLRWTDDGPRERLGVELELISAADGSSRPIQLDDEVERETKIGRMLPVTLFRAAGPAVAPLLERGPRLVMAGEGDRLTWTYVTASGERTSGDVKEGEDIPLPMPMFRLKASRLYRRLRIDSGYEFRGYKAEEEQQVIRVSVSSADGTVADPIWLPIRSRRTLALGDRTFVISWAQTIWPLGFSLKLSEFHRDYYPGTKEPSSFESYCVLRHPEKFPSGEDVKIDMNHPLRLDGWRLFQSRFDGDAISILQVNRDPGLLLTYPACAVVCLGLVVVFFMKRTLRLKRQQLDARGARGGTHVAWAIGSVAAVGIGPLLFGAYAATHERLGLPLSGWPSFVFGVTLLLAAPIVVVWIYVMPFSRRLQSALAGAKP